MGCSNDAGNNLKRGQFIAIQGSVQDECVQEKAIRVAEEHFGCVIGAVLNAGYEAIHIRVLGPLGKICSQNGKTESKHDGPMKFDREFDESISINFRSSLVFLRKIVASVKRSGDSRVISGLF
jgi:NAD(P)-dependent dehydrogenase (short-subunit alcohol dehydrogenase family)